MARDYSNEIVLTENTTISSLLKNEDSYHISGKSTDVVVALPSVLNLRNDLRLDELTLSGSCTIYANGFHLYIGENIITDSRLTVYGGADAGDVSSTKIEIYGGNYNAVYGGSRFGNVDGDTNVIFGGNANMHDGINDSDSASLSPCYIYGGGNDGSVKGSTNVIFEGDAVSKYVYGGGSGANGTASGINILIRGGKVMNVYGGSSSCDLSNCTIDITMTGGLVESVFGGSYGRDVYGNVNVRLLGGEIARRVYTGCYNNWSNFKWSSSYSVNGNTCLTIGPLVHLNTGNGLSSENRTNMGVFCGSRLGKTGSISEINTLIYVDGCYNDQSNKIGDKSGFSWVFYSHEDYIIKASDNGNVTFSDAGRISVLPKTGFYSVVDGEVFFGTVADIPRGTSNVVFKEVFAIRDVYISKYEDCSEIKVTLEINNFFKIKDPKMFVALYDSRNKLLAIRISNILVDKNEYTFTSMISEFYEIRVFIADANLNPLCYFFSKTNVV